LRRWCPKPTKSENSKRIPLTQQNRSIPLGVKINQLYSISAGNKADSIDTNRLTIKVHAISR
jgi:hypothetical protein